MKIFNSLQEMIAHLRKKDVEIAHKSVKADKVKKKKGKK